MTSQSLLRKLKKALIVLLMLIVAFAGYVEIINRNSKNMTYRQKVLKAIYPAYMWLNKIRGKNTSGIQGSKTPPVSFYSLSAAANDGSRLDFNSFRFKKVMLVNTASDCGYTDQYQELQELYDQQKDQLIILAFPANDFKQQEKGTDAEIAQFCKKNYGIRFPLMAKSVVIKSEAQNPVFKWLTDSSMNGWNNKPPSWNFSKYIVNEEGVLTHYFGPTVSPLSNAVKEAIGAK